MNRATLRRLALVPAAVMAGISPSAFAEVPAAVTTAITGAGADLITVMTAVIVAFVAFWGLRKLAAKFGWM